MLFLLDIDVNRDEYVRLMFLARLVCVVFVLFIPVPEYYVDLYMCYNRKWTCGISVYQRDITV